MENDQLTFEKFGYYPQDLKRGSSKHIYATCEVCLCNRMVVKNLYSDICRSCNGKKQIKAAYIASIEKRKIVPYRATEETKEKMRQKRQFRKYKPHTEETKRKISLANTGALSTRGVPHGVAARNKVLKRYRKSAEIKKLDFSLTDEEMMALFSQECYYCGCSPCCAEVSGKKTGIFIYNGIDRKDNSIGYTYENCVTCCKNCNYAKRNMAYKQFITWIGSIHSNLKIKGLI